MEKLIVKKPWKKPEISTLLFNETSGGAVTTTYENTSANNS